MSIEEIIRKALLTVLPAVEPEGYDGEEPEYLTFSCDERPALFGDDAAQERVADVIVSWYAPAGTNPKTRRRAICEALEEAGCTSPRVTNATDEEGLHLSFECEREVED